MGIDDILIVCALEMETDDILVDWNIIYTGVGKLNSAIKLTSHLNDYNYSRPDIVINFGTAGSRDIPIHTLVDCNQFIQRDMDATGLGFVKGQTPFEDELIIDFSNINNPISKGYVCGSGDSFVENIEDEISHIDVFDMEAYALAKVCSLYDIDFVSYKYITDNVNEKSADDWLENCGKGVKEFKNQVLNNYKGVIG